MPSPGTDEYRTLITRLAMPRHKQVRDDSASHRLVWRTTASLFASSLCAASTASSSPSPVRNHGRSKYIRRPAPRRWRKPNGCCASVELSHRNKGTITLINGAGGRAELGTEICTGLPATLVSMVSVVRAGIKRVSAP
jgi:hypothetical protein